MRTYGGQIYPPPIGVISREAPPPPTDEDDEGRAMNPAPESPPVAIGVPPPESTPPLSRATLASSCATCVEM